CRLRLDEYRQFVADCELPADTRHDSGSSDTVGDEWEQLRRRIKRHRILSVAPKWAGLGGGVIAVAAKWGGIAAVVIALAGSSWFAIRALNPSPARLLAQAYHEQRTSEFRLAGAQHSEVRQQRGGDSAFSAPPALLKAQVRLSEANPEDSEILRM